MQTVKGAVCHGSAILSADFLGQPYHAHRISQLTDHVTSALAFCSNFQCRALQVPGRLCCLACSWQRGPTRGTLCIRIYWSSTSSISCHSAATRHQLPHLLPALHLGLTLPSVNQICSHRTGTVSGFHS